MNCLLTALYKISIQIVSFVTLSGLCLRPPGQLLYRPLKTMRLKLKPLIKFCGTRTDPAAETKSIGLAADPAFGEDRRAGALFFARHLDYLIVTQNSQSLPGLGTVWTVSS